MLGKVNWRALLPGQKKPVPALATRKKMNEHTTLGKDCPQMSKEAIAQGLAELGAGQICRGCGKCWMKAAEGLLGIGGRQARVRLTLKPFQAEPAAIAPPKPETPPVAAPARAMEGAEPTEADFSVLDDNLLFVSRQTVAELLGEDEGPGAHPKSAMAIRTKKASAPSWWIYHGDDLGVLIGRRAEILNAMQYIVNLIVSKQVEHWVQVVVDVEGYRARRERQLRQMANPYGRPRPSRPAAARCSNRCPPPNARVVHLELA